MQAQQQRVVSALLAVGVLFLLASPWFGELGAFVAVVGVLDLLLAGGYYALVRAKRDPYSIQALREELEREELEAIEEPEAVADKFLCLRCGQEVDARLKVCPRCGNPM
jgi:hypothetical protein